MVRCAIRTLGQQSDKAAFDDLMKQLSGKLDVYEVTLSKTKYLAGDVRRRAILVWDPSLIDFVGPVYDIENHARGLVPYPVRSVLGSGRKRCNDAFI
jgi:hypothetical protein